MNRKIIGIVALIVAGFLLSSGTGDFIASKKLADHGKTTRGEILTADGIAEHHSVYSGFHLNVRFKTEDGTSCAERIGVTQDVYTNAKIGDAISVHYLPENPHICQAGETVRLQFGIIYRGLTFFAIGLFLLMLKPKEQMDVARRINRSFNTLALEQYEYVSIKAEDFKHLDLAFYNDLQQNLQSRGFVFLDDQENVTLRERNGTRTFIRYLLSSDKSIIADMYHLIPKRPGKPAPKVLDLVTAFSDGTYQCTSNAEGAAKFAYPPSVRMDFLPAVAPWNMVLETHSNSLRAYLETYPQTTVRILNGMADFRRVSDEIQSIKSAFRKQNGLSKAELERLGVGRAFDIDEMHATIARHRERGLD